MNSTVSHAPARGSDHGMRPADGQPAVRSGRRRRTSRGPEPAGPVRPLLVAAPPAIPPDAVRFRPLSSNWSSPPSRCPALPPRRPPPFPRRLPPPRPIGHDHDGTTAVGHLRAAGRPRSRARAPRGSPRNNRSGPTRSGSCPTRGSRACRAGRSGPFPADRTPGSDLARGRADRPLRARRALRRRPRARPGPRDGTRRRCHLVGADDRQHRRRPAGSLPTGRGSARPANRTTPSPRANFAEAFAVWQVGPARYRGVAGPPPTAEQLALWLSSPPVRPGALRWVRPRQRRRGRRPRRPPAPRAWGSVHRAPSRCTASRGTAARPTAGGRMISVGSMAQPWALHPGPSPSCRRVGSRSTVEPTIRPTRDPVQRDGGQHSSRLTAPRRLRRSRSTRGTLRGPRRLTGR